MASPIQSYHHGNLRQELLDVAIKHLRQWGPDKISLRALAREIGVSQTAPYRHFADKNALLAALAADGYARLTAVTETEAGRYQEPAEQIFQAGLVYIHFARDNPDLYKLMFGPVIENPESYPELKASGSQSFETILGIARRGVEDGSFAQEDTALIAMSCWSMVHGIASLWIDGMYSCADSGLSEDVVVAGTLRLALRGILIR
jgi:AcrR family transcriptional regulator